MLMRRILTPLVFIVTFFSSLMGVTKYAELFYCFKVSLCFFSPKMYSYTNILLRTSTSPIMHICAKARRSARLLLFTFFLLVFLSPCKNCFILGSVCESGSNDEDFFLFRKLLACIL